MAPIFSPPTVRARMGDPFKGSPENRLFSRVSFDVGITVVAMPDGSFRQFQEFSSEGLPAGVKIYAGGHVHVISDGEAEALSGAGYGQFITPEGA